MNNFRGFVLGKPVLVLIFNLPVGLQWFTPNTQQIVKNNKIRDFLQIIVDNAENCEELEILPYLLANKLACHFHGSWQKTRNTGSETKDFFAYSTAV